MNESSEYRFPNLRAIERGRALWETGVGRSTREKAFCLDTSVEGTIT